MLSISRKVSLILFRLLAAAGLLYSASPASALQVPLAQHVVLVIEENTSYNTTLAYMPWLVNQGGLNGYAANYYSNVSGSLLDYLWLASGSSETAFGCNGNDCSSPVTDDNIFRLLNDSGMSWKLYALNYLNAGGTVTTPDNARGTLYYRRHNGAVWYSDVLDNTLGSQGDIVDFEQFLIDAAAGTLPRFSIIIPDGMYDGHDGGPALADTFLQNNMGTLLSLPDFKSGGSGLLLVTFDNGDGDAQGQVYTALIGPNVKPGTASYTYYQHQNSLRTMLESLGLTTYPGASASAADMIDLYQSPAGAVVINSPANQSIQGTTVTVNAAASQLGSSIDHLEVWDNGSKLGNVFSTTVNQAFNLGAGSHTMTVQSIGPAPNYAVLHTQTTAFTVSSTNGVFITTPAKNKTQALMFPVNAYAVESTGVDHLEVWADGAKLGDSPKGSTISQWYNSLGAGSHQLTVEAVSSSGTVMNATTITVTVSSKNNIFVNSPKTGTLQGNTMLVNAYAYEQNNANQQVDHLEVWDSGTKLGDSPVSYGVPSLFMNQSYTLGSGTHTVTVQDVGPGPSYPVLHDKTFTVTVK
jgi:acid phosphatase